MIVTAQEHHHHRHRRRRHTSHDTRSLFHLHLLLVAVFVIAHHTLLPLLLSPSSSSLVIMFADAQFVPPPPMVCNECTEVTCVCGQYQNFGCKSCPTGSCCGSWNKYEAAAGSFGRGSECVRNSGPRDASGCPCCAPGSYQPSAGQGGCLPVPAGRYQPSSCATGYGTCGVGTWSPSGASGCTSCPAGTASGATAATSSATCSVCGTGSWSSSGASACTSCPAGTASSATGATSSSVCTTCGQGTWSASGAATCTQCPAGAMSSATGATSSVTCQDCLGGTWSAAGAGTCTPCPAGTFSTAIAATSPMMCQPCDPGTYSNPGATQCTPCDEGTFAPGPGTPGPACGPCPGGQYQNATGQVGCLQCPAGTARAATGATSLSDCKNCSAGTSTNNEEGQLVCTECPYHHCSVVNGSAACTRCPGGSKGGTRQRGCYNISLFCITLTDTVSRSLASPTDSGSMPSLSLSKTHPTPTRSESKTKRTASTSRTGTDSRQTPSTTHSRETDTLTKPRSTVSKTISESAGATEPSGDGTVTWSSSLDATNTTSADSNSETFSVARSSSDGGENASLSVSPTLSDPSPSVDATTASSSKSVPSASVTDPSLSRITDSVTANESVSKESATKTDSISATRDSWTASNNDSSLTVPVTETAGTDTLSALTNSHEVTESQTVVPREVFKIAVPVSQQLQESAVYFGAVSGAANVAVVQQLQRSGALLRIVRCGKDGHLPLSAAQSPTGAAIGGDWLKYHRGAVVYNTIIGVVLVALYALGIPVVMLVKKMTFQEATLKIRFPSYIIVPLSIVAAPTCISGAVLFWYGAGAEDVMLMVFLGLFLPFVPLAFLVALYYAHRRYNFPLYSIKLKSRDLNEEGSLKAKFLRAWYWAVRPTKKWPEKHPFINRYFPLMYPNRFAWFPAFDWLTTMSVSFLGGLATNINAKLSTCIGVSITTHIILCFYMFVQLYTRPTLARVSSAIQIILTSFSLLSSLLSTLILVGLSVGDGMLGLQSAENAVALVGGVFAGIDVAIEFGESLQQQPEDEKMGSSGDKNNTAEQEGDGGGGGVLKVPSLGVTAALLSGNKKDGDADHDPNKKPAPPPRSRGLSLAKLKKAANQHIIGNRVQNPFIIGKSEEEATGKFIQASNFGGDLLVELQNDIDAQVSTSEQDFWENLDNGPPPSAPEAAAAAAEEANDTGRDEGGEAAVNLDDDFPDLEYDEGAAAEYGGDDEIVLDDDNYGDYDDGDGGGGGLQYDLDESGDVWEGDENARRSHRRSGRRGVIAELDDDNGPRRQATDAELYRTMKERGDFESGDFSGVTKYELDDDDDDDDDDDGGGKKKRNNVVSGGGPVDRTQLHSIFSGGGDGQTAARGWGSLRHNRRQGNTTQQQQQSNDWSQI